MENRRWKTAGTSFAVFMGFFVLFVFFVSFVVAVDFAVALSLSGFSMTPLRVAFIGCGIISEAHARAYSKFPDRARITVCCDIDPEKARARAEQVGDARVETDVAAVLADPDVDAVEIMTPHHLHTDAVVAAAKAGKQILCQKPLAKTLEECDRMIEAAREAGVILFYGEMNRTLPAGIKARQAIDEGRIGQLIGIQATFAHWQGGVYMSTAWRYDPNITGGGQLLDGGIHAISLMNRIGGPMESVSCFTQRFRPELGGEDTAVLICRYAEGHLGQLFSSQASGVWFPGATLAAFGTEGAITLGGPHGALTLHRNDLPDRREVLVEDRSDAFAAMIESYLDTVQKGTPNPSPGEIGREDLSVVLAAYESAKLGREVKIAEIDPRSQTA
jgi:predicted dehydrogenase